MNSRRIRRPSPSMAIALIALFVALGGTGYAAINLPRNSVAAKHIKKGAVRTSEVKNRSLRRTDFKRGQLPRGPRGERGERGPAGAAGLRYFASLEPDGERRSGNATAGERPAAGKYNARFARDVSRCSAAVTPGWNAGGEPGGGVPTTTYVAFPGYAWTPTMGLERAANSVAVEFRESGGAPTDSDFHLVVAC